jgi:hypothetical protein
VDAATTGRFVEIRNSARPRRRRRQLHLEDGEDPHLADGHQLPARHGDLRARWHQDWEENGDMEWYNAGTACVGVER